MNESTTRRSGSRGRIDWIELVTGFGCNCRCIVCSSGRLAPGPELSSAELKTWLGRGRELSARGVWFGGGEPSLHPGLVAAVELAGASGYERIRIQTNGLRFAYPAFASRLVSAGANEFSLSVKGLDAGAHDAMTRNPRAFELMTRAAANLVGLGARVEADVLITTGSMEDLSGIVERLAGLGVSALTFWLVSLHGLAESDCARWLPSLSDLAPHLELAFDRARALGLEATSLHTPPCVLSPPYRRFYRHAGDYRLLVVVPGGEPFMAEESPMEGGVFPGACRGCGLRADCLGLRADYLSVHGDAGIEPITMK